MKYSIVKGLKKMVKYAVLFGIPVLVDQLIVAYPLIAQMTVGTLLVGLVNYLKIKSVPLFRSV